MPKKATISIKKSVLEWALKRSGCSAGNLRGKFRKIDSWLDGSAQPTLKQLEDFSRTTLIPFGYLLLNNPPEISLPIPHFRTIGNHVPKNPSLKLVEIVHQMQLRQGWAREYFIQEGMKPLPYVKSITLQGSPKLIAKKMQSILGMNNKWASKGKQEDSLKKLCQAMEKIGIFSVTSTHIGMGNHKNQKLDPQEFRGFVLVDEYAPFVFVNGVDSPSAQMFTLAHELAHIFLGESACFDLKELQPHDNPNEKLCNEIAAEFLVPEDELKKIWDHSKPPKINFIEIRNKFKVSALVIARRALDLNLIRRSEFFNFYNEDIRAFYEEKRKEKESDQKKEFKLPAKIKRNSRIGKNFGKIVIQAVKERKLLYLDAYRLTGLRGKSFDDFATELGFNKKVKIDKK